MKNILAKKTGAIFGLFLLVTILASCLEEPTIPIKEPDRYGSDDVKSYAIVFHIFWTSMDEGYNFFLEQYQKDGMDWDRIYTEYYPKFAALKTFGKAPGVTIEEVQRDTDIARQYFTDIMKPIIDRHLKVSVVLPSLNGLTKYTFTGDRGVINNSNYFTDTYMPDRITGDTIRVKDAVLAGNLLTNPNIYYLGLRSFKLATNFRLDLYGTYLFPAPGNKYILQAKEIDTNTSLLAIKDINLRNRAKGFTTEILNNWNAFLNLKDVNIFNRNVTEFRATEVVSNEFMNVARTLLDSSRKLPAYNDSKTYSSINSAETSAYIEWFMGRMYEHVVQGYELPDFQKAAGAVINRGPFYKKFLNPLKRGEIKKLIIDLRGNGGGNVLDLKYFTNRLVTERTIFGYQRLKEGNGRFNYTPWTPMYTNPHQFGVPSKIPVVILTDYASASTSEISTMMLKSQGEHIISVGDYSQGATAGLVGNSDNFNVNSTNRVAGGYLEFYMPVLAVKDENGKVIEGVGIKPNIPVPALTGDEVREINSSPKTFVDKVLNAAVEHLK